MRHAIAIAFVALFAAGCESNRRDASLPAYDESLLAVTPAVTEYAITTLSPLLKSQTGHDTLAQLLMVSTILTDPTNGIAINRMDPGKYMIYDLLSNVGLGFLSTAGLSPAQKNVLRRWHRKYMQKNPADVFFAPSADEIIKSRAAFGCTHYARAFIAVVKALGLITRPDSLRYAISSKADDYNRAQERKDARATINGHQFVMVNIDARWIAINTSKGEYTEMAPDFSPDSCAPPRNTPIRFHAYPDIVFLIRRIGADWNDDCRDNSRSSLMNISRSGKPDDPSFLWDRFDLPAATPASPIKCGRHRTRWPSCILTSIISALLTLAPPGAIRARPTQHPGQGCAETNDPDNMNPTGKPVIESKGNEYDQESLPVFAGHGMFRFLLHGYGRCGNDDRLLGSVGDPHHDKFRDHQLARGKPWDGLNRICHGKLLYRASLRSTTWTSTSFMFSPTPNDGAASDIGCTGPPEKT